MAIEKYLMASHLIEPHLFKIEEIRKLSVGDIDEINIASKLLGTFNLCYSLFQICTENYLLIEEYYARLIRIKGFNQNITHDIQIKWNTLFLNFLSSFRSFNDHQETVFSDAKKLNPSDDRYSSFKSETGSCYDNNFSYRFLWKLRDYIQHCGFGFIKLEFTGIGKDKEVNETIVKITLDKNSLLANYDGWGKVKSDLQNQSDAIELIKHIRSLYSSIQKLAQFIAERNIEILGDKREYLLGLFKEVVEKYPDAEPVIYVYDNQNKKNSEPLGIEFLPLYSLFIIQDTYLGKNPAFFDPNRIIPEINDT